MKVMIPMVEIQGVCLAIQGKFSPMYSTCNTSNDGTKIGGRALCESGFVFLNRVKTQDDIEKKTLFCGNFDGLNSRPEIGDGDFHTAAVSKGVHIDVLAIFQLTKVPLS